ncbi:hypothetical protein Tco_0178831 [Tanacetum coccineum]
MVGARNKKEKERKRTITSILLNLEKIHMKRHINHTYAEVFILSIHSQPTQQSGVWEKDTTDVTTENLDEFPGMETKLVAEQDSAPKKKRGRPPSHVDGVRIYHKNHRRSERIANMKEKKAFEFDNYGTGSTPDKAFDVSD